jgi:hypothetical protein
MESSLLLSSLGSGALFSIYGGNRSQLWMIEEGGDLVLAVDEKGWSWPVLACLLSFPYLFPFFCLVLQEGGQKVCPLGQKVVFGFLFWLVFS